MYTQLGVLTKGTVIEVNVSELGMVTTGGKVVFGKYAQITNNPENDGCINAVLREFYFSLTNFKSDLLFLRSGMIYGGIAVSLQSTMFVMIPSSHMSQHAILEYVRSVRLLSTLLPTLLFKTL